MPRPEHGGAMISMNYLVETQSSSPATAQPSTGRSDNAFLVRIIPIPQFKVTQGSSGKPSGAKTIGSLANSGLQIQVL
jgi:hypothetical protein